MDTVSYLLGKKAGGGSGSNLQTKSVEITQNGSSTISPDEGYDGLSAVNLTTSVPQPSGKITITQNGTDIDVSSYATADVSVGGSAPTTMAGFISKFNQDIGNFYTYIVDGAIKARDAYTNNSVILHSANPSCKYYIIRKRNNVYSVIWVNSILAWLKKQYGYFENVVVGNTYYSLSNTAPSTVFDTISLPTQVKFNTANISVSDYLGYYSSDTFATAEEAIQGMIDNTITYTTTSSYSYGMQVDTEDKMIPYTNMALLSNDGTNVELANTNVISHNETIV